MKRRTFLKVVPGMVLAGGATSFAEEMNQPAPAKPKMDEGNSLSAGAASNTTAEMQPIALLKPEMDGGKSVLASLKERKTIRNIRAEQLSPQTLSNLL